MLRALAGAYYLNVVAATVPVPGDDREPVRRRSSRASPRSSTAGGRPEDGPPADEPDRQAVAELVRVRRSPEPTAPTARMGNISSLAKGIAEHVQKVAKG